MPADEQEDEEMEDEGFPDTGAPNSKPKAKAKAKGKAKMKPKPSDSWKLSKQARALRSPLAKGGKRSSSSWETDPNPKSEEGDSDDEAKEASGAKSEN